MTYSIIRMVDIDCGDHGFSYERTIKSGIKTIKQAEYYLRKICGSKKYENTLKKEFIDRHAIEQKELYTIVDEDDVPASEYYWERKIWKSEKSLFDEIGRDEVKSDIDDISNRITDAVLNNESEETIRDLVNKSMEVIDDMKK